MKLIDDIGLSHLIGKLKALIGLKADKTYVDGKIKTDVPVGAKFTDTVYSHPPTHPASMITGLPNSLPADGGNADTVGGFTVGVNVPADAVFTDTDTVTTINGKTGAISKADIVALGIPSQDTNTTYTAGTNIAITGNTISATDTVVDVSGKADKTYVDNKVKTDVPTDAKFTDTVVDIADNLTTDDATKALSAKQGKILDEKSPNKEFYQPHPTKTNHATGNAEGEQTTASGYVSRAEGEQTTASGYVSHAEGGYTTASGYASHAEGMSTIASGIFSHAEGGDTVASGDVSHAQNEGTTAQGEAQTAIGKYNIPQGTKDSHLPDDHAFIIGNGDGYGNRSNALTVNWQGDVDIAGDYKIAGEALYSKAEIDNKVKTDVPTGAKFTDTNTITTINGKTGAISKADITALGIPAQDTVYTHPTTHSISEVSGLQTALDGKADDSQVLTNVPLNAKFTDTVYSHPSSHPASMITESSTKRFVSDSEKSTWNSKSDTDTVTTINGKTGAISKADIVALGVPAQDTVYGVATTSANGLMSGTDKTNLNSNTSARHSHTNKATLDKITEVGEELKYNGETVVTKTSFTWARLKGAMSWAELIGM